MKFKRTQAGYNWCVLWKRENI